MSSPHNDVILCKRKLYVVVGKGMTEVMGLDLDTSMLGEVHVYSDGGDKKYLAKSNGELLLVDCGKWGNFSSYFVLQKCTVFLIESQAEPLTSLVIKIKQIHHVPNIIFELWNPLSGLFRLPSDLLDFKVLEFDEKHTVYYFIIYGDLIL